MFKDLIYCELSLNLNYLIRILKKLSRKSIAFFSWWPYCQKCKSYWHLATFLFQNSLQIFFWSLSPWDPRVLVLGFWIHLVMFEIDVLLFSIIFLRGAVHNINVIKHENKTFFTDRVGRLPLKQPKKMLLFFWILSKWGGGGPCPIFSHTCRKCNFGQ